MTRKTASFRVYEDVDVVDSLCVFGSNINNKNPKSRTRTPTGTWKTKQIAEHTLIKISLVQLELATF